MYFDQYAPWDHYPKTLRLSERQNPMSVVIDFFSADRLPGHSKRLKEWRDFVIVEEHYDHQLYGPGVLIFTCEQNQKLLEAMYLLLLKYQGNYNKPEGITATQLQDEKVQWDYFPEDLTEDELLHPYAIVEKVFRKITPQHYRDYLNEWLYVALVNTANDESLPARYYFSFRKYQ